MKRMTQGIDLGDGDDPKTDTMCEEMPLQVREFMFRQPDSGVLHVCESHLAGGCHKGNEDAVAHDYQLMRGPDATRGLTCERGQKLEVVDQDMLDCCQ